MAKGKNYWWKTVNCPTLAVQGWAVNEWHSVLSPDVVFPGSGCWPIPSDASLSLGMPTVKYKYRVWKLISDTNALLSSFSFRNTAVKALLLNQVKFKLVLNQDTVLYLFRKKHCPLEKQNYRFSIYNIYHQSLIQEALLAHTTYWSTFWLQSNLHLCPT